MNNSKKVIILGASGMLGHDLAEVFKEYNPTLFGVEDLDITDQQDVMDKLTDLQPEIIINAAAYTDVDGAQNNQEAAFAVNALAVGYLAQACKNIGAILIHFSTDSVFDGKNENGYKETDSINPINVYGKSKAEGEQLMQEKCDDYYLIRTSWLYGHAPQAGKPRGLNFVATMLKLAQEKDELNVVNDQFGKPTFTKDLAKETRRILENQEPFGIYHIVNDGVCTWYDFAKEIFEIKGVDIKVNPISSAEYPMLTPRPKYSVLINTKLEPLRSWQEALKEYLK